MNKLLIYLYRIISRIYCDEKKKKTRMETGLNVNFCVRKEWNKNTNSYLPCLHKIALGEFTRNQYKNLAVGTRSRG